MMPGWETGQPVEETARNVAADRIGFHRFASGWYGEIAPAVQPRTAEMFRWALSHHLLPFFKDHQLTEITVAEIDRYRTEKLVEHRLAASSINKTIRLLGQILDQAVERELLYRNPMWVNRRRRFVRAAPATRTYLSRAIHIQALLDAGEELDQEATHGHRTRRAILTTLVFAGLRISELLELRWTDVDINQGRLIVRHGKTPAASREIEMLPALVEELGLLWGVRRVTGRDLVFSGARTGAWTTPNVRKRVLRPSCQRANLRLEQAGAGTLPEPVTHHSLRRTFASVLFALGRTPPEVMEALGHIDARLTLRIYARAMRRDPGEVQILRALTGLATRAHGETG
jgi:integrase